MRDPARIDAFCTELKDVWEHNFPDWRFGQLICNLQRYAGQDLFYLEDSRFLDLLDEFDYNMKNNYL